MHDRAPHAPSRTLRVAAIACVAGVGGFFGPACGLGDKAELERRITSAPARLEGTVVSGTIAVESRLTKVPAGVNALAAAAPPGTPGTPATAGVGTGFPPDGVSIGTRAVRFLLDAAGSRAALLDAAPDAPPDPTVVFDDLVLYGRRGGVPADDARPWVRLDLGDLGESAGELDPLDGEGVNAVYALHPAVLTDLVGGTLTGSIERRDDPALEAGLTSYDVNISIRKALRDTRRSRYPEARRNAVEELLRLLGVAGDLHPGEVTLDADGRIRRFRLVLRQEPQPKVEFRMIVSVEVEPEAPPDGAAFAPPSSEQVLGVDSVLRFTSTVVATGEDEQAGEGEPSGEGDGESGQPPDGATTSPTPGAVP